MKADFYSVIIEEEIDTGYNCSLLTRTLATFHTLSSAKSYARHIKKIWGIDIFDDVRVFVVPQTWGKYKYNSESICKRGI